MKIDPLPAGIGGHTSDDMLARLKRDVRDKKPDWVRLVMCSPTATMRDYFQEQGMP